MTVFGLNSPEIFVLLVIALIILGTKRIEKGLNLFLRLLKFLLSNHNSNDSPNINKVYKRNEEYIQAKEEKVIKTVDVTKTKEIEPSKETDESQAKEEKIIKTLEVIKAKDIESIKDIEETKKTKEQIEKRLNTVIEKNKGKKQANTINPKGTLKGKTVSKPKTKDPKRTVKDKTTSKPKTIKDQSKQLNKQEQPSSIKIEASNKSKKDSELKKNNK